MSSYDEDHAGSSNPAKRAIEEQDRKGSMDEGGGSKKKRISLSCAQCTSLCVMWEGADDRCKEETKGWSIF